MWSDLLKLGMIMGSGLWKKLNFGFVKFGVTQ